MVQLALVTASLAGVNSTERGFVGSAEERTSVGALGAEHGVGQRDGVDIVACSRSSTISGSTKNDTGRSTLWPGVEMLLGEAEALDLVEIVPALSGVTLKVAVPVIGCLRVVDGAVGDQLLLAGMHLHRRAAPAGTPRQVGRDVRRRSAR